jgi:hypothetical protein
MEAAESIKFNSTVSFSAKISLSGTFFNLFVTDTALAATLSPVIQ